MCEREHHTHIVIYHILPPVDYVHGQSDNLLRIGTFTMTSFLSGNIDIVAAEIKNVKTK